MHAGFSVLSERQVIIQSIKLYLGMQLATTNIRGAYNTSVGEIYKTILNDSLLPADGMVLL